MRERVVLALAVGLAAWAAAILRFGGIDTSLLGLTIRSNEWSDPAALSLVSVAILFAMRGKRFGREPLRQRAVTALRAWRSRDGLVMTAILLVAAVARVWGLTFGLPFPLSRPDEEAISAIAGGFYGGALLQYTFFTYPPLFMLVVAGTLWLLFKKIPATLARVGVHVTTADPGMAAERITARLLSAAAGVASVWLIFRIGARLFDRRTAIVAAAFLALAFLHVRDSHFGVTDIAMTFMVLAAFLAIARFADSGSTRDLVFAAVMTGLAVGTKYNAALLALPAAFAILSEREPRSMLTRMVRLAALGVVAATTFFVICPSALTHFPTMIADLSEVSRHLETGHNVDLGRGWTYHVTTTLRYGLGAPLLLAGIAGLALLVWREGRRGVLVVLFPLAYYGVAGSGRTVFMRHMLPAVPFLCLTAAYAVTTASTWLSGALQMPRRQAWIAAALAIAVLWPSAMSVVAFDRILAREDTRVMARRWIEARFAPGTTLAQVGGGAYGSAYAGDESRYAAVVLDQHTRPTLVVVASSPLLGPLDLAGAETILSSDYDLAFTAVAGGDDPRNTYDRQDAFYVPVAGFHGVERPGPDLQVFVRRR